MKKTVFAVLALVGLSLSTAACAPQPQSYDANGNPVASQGNNDALMAGAGGFLLGRMLSSGSGGATSHTVIQKNYYSGPRRSVYRSGFSRRSSFGSSRSYSSSFGRSSGFGRRR